MQVLITIDTELSAARHQQGMTPADNFACSILGRCPAGEFGIGWQMDLLDRYGLRGVFFIDPLPGLVLGEGVVAEAIRRVVEAGHDAQLHAHTEWLAWAPSTPVGDRRGRNIGDFSLSDQIALLEYGCAAFERAGAPRPVAFRAGNFGADDRTLLALAEVGIRFDTSQNPAYQGGECRLMTPRTRSAPIRHSGVIELPVSGLHDRGAHFRPAQVCAVSAREMTAALRHGAATGWSHFTVVSHSFEMLSRDRLRPNRQVMRRFERLAEEIARHPDLDTTTFADLDGFRPAPEDVTRLGPNLIRTAGRLAEQAWGRLVHERA